MAAPQLNPFHKNTSNSIESESSPILSGIPKYDEKIFPLLKQGQDPFNWWAALNAPYWYPQHGLWHSWNKYILPLTLGEALVEHANKTALSWIWFAVSVYAFYHIGKTANRDFYNLVEHNPQTNLNSKSGFMGLFLTLFIYLGTLGALGDLSSDKFTAINPMSRIEQIESLENDNTNTQANHSNDTAVEVKKESHSSENPTQNQFSTPPANPPSALPSNPPSAPSTPQVGDSIQMNCIYWGISSVQDRKVITLKDNKTKTLWYATFNESHLPEIQSWKVGEEKNINCRVTLSGTIQYCHWE